MSSSAYIHLSHRKAYDEPTACLPACLSYVQDISFVSQQMLRRPFDDIQSPGNVSLRSIMPVIKISRHRLPLASRITDDPTYDVCWELEPGLRLGEAYTVCEQVCESSTRH
jgi:hypothetical protein